MGKIRPQLKQLSGIMLPFFFITHKPQRGSFDKRVPEQPQPHAGAGHQLQGDRGGRAVLNLGHTFAHAIEIVTDHAVRHGEAVAMGMVAAARISQAEGLLAPSAVDRIVSVLRGFDLPTHAPRALDH